MHGVTPSGHQPGEEDEQAAFVVPERGTFELAEGDDQLLGGEASSQDSSVARQRA